MTDPPLPKKLIEVALPLEAINEASAYDKMPGIGPHPKGIHHWWARLPLPCARAIIFSSLVNDPSSDPKWANQSVAAQDKERDRLFGIIQALLNKKNHLQREAFTKADLEIARSCDNKIPELVDPFCGGGSIPLEGQRLGLKVLGTDLNPVAVLITKAQIEIIPKFARHAPVNPRARQTVAKSNEWSNSGGLANDVRYYARWIQKQAVREVGLNYPKVRLSPEQGGNETDVVAFLWARTVRCQNPACGAVFPLVRTFSLAKKNGGQTWVEPVIKRTKRQVTIEFQVRNTGTPPAGTVNRRGAKCIACSNPMKFDEISKAGRAGEITPKLMVVVAVGKRGRVYLTPSPEQEHAAIVEAPGDAPETDLPKKALSFRVQRYGMLKHRDIFTVRQLKSITVLSNLAKQVHSQVIEDAAGAPHAKEYADAVSLFLSFAVDRCVDFNNSLCRWSSSNEKVMNLFARHAIPMVWDFAEANIVGDGVGAWMTCSDYVADCIETVVVRDVKAGKASQMDAVSAKWDVANTLVSTDPPYYDNMGYADLSDFFYVWLRRSIGEEFRDIFSTVLVPKEPELAALPARFSGDTNAAREHFESGLHKVFTSLKKRLDPRFPMSVYYAFKQADEEKPTEDDAKKGQVTAYSATGWETMLDALISSGFQITGTWPVRVSQAWRMEAMGSNALASYIVLVCRPLPPDSAIATRRDFIASLRKELPGALRKLQSANIAPVDLAQSAIGPGMAIFSRYMGILEAEGTRMSVRTALQIINQELDAFLNAQDSELDRETRFCIAWFEQYGNERGPFGEADVLARAKNTSVDTIANLSLMEAKGGFVRIVERTQLPKDANVGEVRNLTVWRCMQELIRALDTGGEAKAAIVVNQIGVGPSEASRELAYRLFSICEKKSLTEEAMSYNNLVNSWQSIREKAGLSTVTNGQTRLDV